MCGLKDTFLLITSFAFLLLAGCSSNPHQFETSKTKASPDLSYVIRPLMQGDVKKLLVEMSFRGNETGRDDVWMLKNWSGVNGIADTITNLKTLSEQTTIQTRSDHETFIASLSYPPNGIVTLHYTVTVQPGGHNLKPRLDPQSFFFFAKTALLIPNWPKDKNIQVALNWRGFDKSLRIVSDYGELKTTTILTTTPLDILSSFYAGSKFSKARLESKNKLTIFIHPSLKLNTKLWLQNIHKSWQATKEFWHPITPPQQNFLLWPHIKNCCLYYGQHTRNSGMVIFVPHEPNLTTQSKNLITHEMFHTWNGSMLKSVSEHGDWKWFKEGFTDYYAKKINHRAGITKPLKHSTRKTSPAAYQKGDAIAALWDDYIRTHNPGHSLDDVMKSIIKNTDTLSWDVLINTLGKYSKKTPSDVLQQLKRQLQTDSGI